ncbi:hypothetical protein ER57_02740 [Smithella sp. SCADC]|nr:hypothetical protein ER57_02740 [Smithella sp. SCADC]
MISQISQSLRSFEMTRLILKSSTGNIDRMFKIVNNIDAKDQLSIIIPEIYKIVFCKLIEDKN